MNCPECQRTNTYATAREYVCRKCGHRWARPRAVPLFPDATCRWCRHEWTPRTANPNVCPKCQRAGWQVGAKP